jgi:hypothetical protein
MSRLTLILAAVCMMIVATSGDTTIQDVESADTSTAGSEIDQPTSTGNPNVPGDLETSTSQTGGATRHTGTGLALTCLGAYALRRVL